jgi:hypothetical protein
MNEPNLHPDETRLRALLREARTAPALPPRFGENVWRKIESASAPERSTAAPWLDVLAGWLMRPRLAFAVAAVLLLAGGGLGWNQGQQLARHEAQARYVAAVAPGVLR